MQFSSIRNERARLRHGMQSRVELRALFSFILLYPFRLSSIHALSAINSLHYFRRATIYVLDSYFDSVTDQKTNVTIDSHEKKSYINIRKSLLIVIICYFNYLTVEPYIESFISNLSRCTAND